MDGFAGDLVPLKEILNKYGVVVIPECNQGRTNSGIQEGAQRLYDYITHEIQKFNSKYISLVCHGLGGLYARYALMLLHKQNVIPGDVTPLNFITIATHHLGSRYYYNTLGKDLQAFVFGIILGQTGKELLLRDDENNPILLQMTKREFLVPLDLFEKRVTYSYCKSNSSSQYRTSSLKRRSTLNLSGQKPVESSQPHIVIDTEKEMMEDPEEDNHENTILNALERLDWIRMAIVSGKSIFSSVDMSKSEFWKTKNAYPVMQSVASQFESHLIDDKELEKPAIPPKGDVHLVVLIHGLDGFNTDLAFIGARLKSRFLGPLFKLLAPECNHGRTYDGILAGATRIYQCVQEEIKQTNVKFISVVGHSLGGMYGRCLIGLMYQDGLIPNKIQPINYISLATPHLGSREHGKIFGENVTSAVLGTFIGNTGRG
ncbi:hypothetical protein HDV01_000227 [Terramyces sp. JEL0728]|nr:hypothetical protein HDV01_000227 [Terramyces sp. JEL0728]